MDKYSSSTTTRKAMCNVASQLESSSRMIRNYADTVDETKILSEETLSDFRRIVYYSAKVYEHAILLGIEDSFADSITTAAPEALEKRQVPKKSLPLPVSEDEFIETPSYRKRSPPLPPASPDRESKRRCFPRTTTPLRPRNLFPGVKHTQK